MGTLISYSSVLSDLVLSFIRVKDKLWRPTQGGIEVESSNRLALVGVCDDICTQNAQYSWGMYRMGLYGSWLEIEREELEQYATGRKETRGC